MNRLVILFILLFTVFLGSCSKEESEQITSFKGTVFYQGMSMELFTNGQIEIIGSELESYGDYRKSFPIGSYGRFEFEITTTNIDNFQLKVKSNEVRITGLTCIGTASGTADCTLIDPNKDYTDLKVFVHPPLN